ncbi:hypothetical protein H6G72_07075 [Planktothricoides sp. FACHB-1370]|uniref:Uncharacterized protein n=1 Tax=Planktothricoides raciborskii FACHB-1370 TaxID=2949576 RepID=A0ABR8EBC4_9CYAN|nr:hypothetical protein [Planktothricoides raciborskii FACHB-1370]
MKSGNISIIGQECGHRISLVAVFFSGDTGEKNARSPGRRNRVFLINISIKAKLSQKTGLFSCGLTIFTVLYGALRGGFFR